MTATVPAGADAAPSPAGRRTREHETELPVGHLDEDGRLHRAAVLRKMTGHEEALLADRRLRANGGKLVTELLTSCLRRLGEIEPVPHRTVAALTSPDRNYLLLELRKITFGSELTAHYTCPSCHGTTTALEDLEGFPVRRGDAAGALTITVDLADGYEDRTGGTWYTRLTFRLPTGLDEEKVAGAARENPSRGTNALLTRCLTQVADEQGERMPDARREALGTRLVSDLTMPDRGRIEQAFRDGMPGLDLSREIDCADCGRLIRTAVDLEGFFTPT
ncbi:hypothetical protein [Streptomyces sp. NPDC059010]|uniref:T4 family baseplate hub assembly chaperone n=1 Tax=Streptomyces sp. NPDC059010 TaxID=3346695 RepID=UPI00367E7E60